MTSCVIQLFLLGFIFVFRNHNDAAMPYPLGDFATRHKATWALTSSTTRWSVRMPRTDYSVLHHRIANTEHPIGQSRCSSPNRARSATVSTQITYRSISIVFLKWYNYRVFIIGFVFFDCLLRAQI